MKSPINLGILCSFLITFQAHASHFKVEVLDGEKVIVCNVEPEDREAIYKKANIAYGHAPTGVFFKGDTDTDLFLQGRHTSKIAHPSVLTIGDYSIWSSHQLPQGYVSIDMVRPNHEKLSFGLLNNRVGTCLLDWDEVKAEIEKE